MMNADEPFTRLNDITAFHVHYKPQGLKPALWDCPKVIRDAAMGRPPELKKLPVREELPFVWRELVALSLMFGGFMYMVVEANPQIAWAAPGAGLVAALSLLVVAPMFFARDDERLYGIRKDLFDAFASSPDLYRDEIFKHAVHRLPLLDFYGRHRAVNEARVGRYEREVIEMFRRFGIRQETTVVNRGRPFLIHQYELIELGWGNWEDGATKNYTLDLAVLWPERCMKFNVEVDDPSHQERGRVSRDVDRDEILTSRGWFVRRLNHKYISEGLQSGKLDKAIKEIVSIIYFFAKYANNEELEIEHRWGAMVANRRFRSTDAKRHAQRVADAIPARSAAAAETTSEGAKV